MAHTPDEEAAGRYQSTISILTLIISAAEFCEGYHARQRRQRHRARRADRVRPVCHPPPPAQRPEEVSKPLRALCTSLKSIAAQTT